MKNTHIEHPEDSILTGDLSVLDWFVTEGKLSLKIDGAPAIVWGRNPATGNFFVGTKSVFNKVKIRINESHEDIDKNHAGPVQRFFTFAMTICHAPRGFCRETLSVLVVVKSINLTRLPMSSPV